MKPEQEEAKKKSKEAHDAQVTIFRNKVKVKKAQRRARHRARNKRIQKLNGN